MSLLTPVKVPVSVYKWDDVDAPQLDKSPNCVATIFKACLAIGYGDKEPAGWTMPFEDTSAGVKVFKPAVSLAPDYYLRVSDDTGTEMAAQVYLNMKDANTGDLKLQCATAYKYAKGKSSGRWLLLATSIGLWFFTEQARLESVDIGTSGSYFFVGEIKSSLRADRVVYIQHTGGSYNNANFSPMTGIYEESGAYLSGRLLSNNTVYTVNFRSIANGQIYPVDTPDSAPLYCIANRALYVLPGIFVPIYHPRRDNFDTVLVSDNTDFNAIVFGAAGWGPTRFFLKTDYWIY